VVALLAMAPVLAVFVPVNLAAADSSRWAPVHTGDFPDPSIMQFGGLYYAFSTQNFATLANTVNIQTSTSTDGINWTASSTDALPTLGSWAKKGNTWAPSVAMNPSGEFVMYYTATEASTGDQCIGRAISSTPGGPYYDSQPAPVVCQTNLGGSIDPDIFIDNGTATLIWKSDGNHVGAQTYIWAQPLSSDLMSLTSVPSELLAVDQPWQGSVIEGPDMVDHLGVDYLFYSGGDYGSAAYSIGFAVCPASLTSMCTDNPANPILTSQAGMSGPGGPEVFMSPAHQAYMAFAAWQGSTVGYLNCGIRPMYLANVSWPTQGVVSVSAAVVSTTSTSPSCAPPPPPPGYWQVASDGGIFTFGAAQFYGSTGSLRLNKPVVAMAATPDGRGYWLVASDGGIFSFGDAQFYGSTGSIRLNKPIVGMVSTIDGQGYWLVASDGGIFSFGDAPFYGSLGGQNIGYPITAMAPGYLGGGYWMADANGQVFAFGDAKYWGEPSYAPGAYRITGMAETGNASGYWLTSANGNVADEGNAAPYGDLIGTTLNSPIVGMSATRSGAGYWLQGGDGGIFCFGDAGYMGSMGGKHLNSPMVGIASV
jgi:hypothetical protein